MGAGRCGRGLVGMGAETEIEGKSAKQKERRGARETYAHTCTHRQTYALYTRVRAHTGRQADG